MKKPSLPVIGIAYKMADGENGILLRSKCHTEAEYNNRFAYVYEMADEFCLIHEGDEINPERMKYERKYT